jgi:hypothetical protein
VRVYKTKRFARFARGQKISDAMLWAAIRRAERGLLDADLGGGVVKQRVARPGQGKSGGFRVLVAFRPRTRSVLLFGFAKSERGNIDNDELATLRDIAAVWLEADEKVIARAVAAGEIQEVRFDDEEKKG